MIFITTFFVLTLSQNYMIYSQCKVDEFKGKCSIYKTLEFSKKRSYYAKYIKNTTKGN